MRQRFLVTLLFAAALLTATHLDAQTKPSATAPMDPLDRLISPATQRDMGLEKLTLDQRTKLASVIAKLAREGELTQSATAYVENEGFSRVTVHGVKSLKLADGIKQDYMIVEDRRGVVYACDDVIFANAPGTYWARVKAFGPSAILDRNGIERRIFRAEEIR